MPRARVVVELARWSGSVPNGMTAQRRPGRGPPPRPAARRSGHGRGHAGAADRDPAVAVLGDVARTGSGPAAPPSSTGTPVAAAGRTSGPAWARPTTGDGDVLAVERRHLVGPQRLHGQHPLRGRRPGGSSSVTPWSSSSSTFQPKPMPSANRPPRQVVERGDLLGGDDRVALGRQAMPVPIRSVGGDRRGHGQRDERVEACACTPRRAGSPVGRGRDAAGGDVGVLGEPQRGEAPRLGLAGQLDRVHALVGEEDRDAEVHARQR